MTIDMQSVGEKINYEIKKHLTENGYVGGNIGVISNPPVGYKKITNIYYNPNDGSIVVEVAP